VTKATVSAPPTIKTVTTPKSTPNQQNVVVKRPPGAIVNVSSSKPSVIPKPVLKFTSSSKVRVVVTTKLNNFHYLNVKLFERLF
jgi:hypothetical protein